MTSSLPISEKKQLNLGYPISLLKSCAELGIGDYAIKNLNVIDLQTLITSMRIDEARRFKAEQRALKGNGQSPVHYKASNNDINNL